MTNLSKIITVAALSISVCLMSGCHDSGDKFVGNWTETSQNINGKGDKLDISCKSDTCHMTTESFDSISWNKTESDGTIQSSNTLSFGGGMELWTIDSNGIMHQGNQTYKKN